jgi:hypothetical protein
MTDQSPYHEGMRSLQDERDTRRIADRLAEVTLRQVFTDEDRAFIERCPMVFVATADAAGRPDCSYKGGLPGFVRVLDGTTLAIPDYDGNGMYRSWGQPAGQSAHRPAVHRFRKPQAHPRQRPRQHHPRRSAPARMPGRRLHCARDRRGDLPELPALHPPHAAHRALRPRPAPGLHPAGAGVEALRGVPRLPARSATARLIRRLTLLVACRLSLVACRWSLVACRRSLIADR